LWTPCAIKSGRFNVDTCSFYTLLKCP
jgi:hypothetical protein